MYRYILCILALALLMTACNKAASDAPPAAQAAQEAEPAQNSQEAEPAQNAQDAKPAQDAQNAEPAQNAQEAPAEAAEPTKADAPEQPVLNTQFTIGDKEVTFPAFAIDVKLDDAAKSKLAENNETIIVAAYYGFYPGQKSPKKYSDYVGEDGVFSITEARIEIKPDMTRATFDQVTCPREIFDIITDEDKPKIEVLINIFSGRRAFPNNLLSCDILQNKLNDVAGKHYSLACKLI